MMLMLLLATPAPQAVAIFDGTTPEQEGLIGLQIHGGAKSQVNQNFLRLTNGMVL